MSTGKDYGLPAEYADWVEVPSINSVGVKSDYILIEVLRYSNGPLERAERVHQRCFVPPKPKPTLPDVKLGGVVRYRDAEDQLCIAVRIGDDQWVNFTRQDETPAKLFAAIPWTDDDLLGDADDDGFTVELEGL